MLSVVCPVHPDRLVPLKDVLHITDHQSTCWMKFYAAVDAAIRVMPSSAATDSDPTRARYPSLPNAIENELRQHLLRVEACRALQTSVTELYAVLSNKQRLLANRLLVPLVGGVMTNGQTASIPQRAERHAGSVAA